MLKEARYTPFKHHSFAPYATDLWTEYWYPVLLTNGMVKANEYGALNVKTEDGWLKIYFSPTQNINDKIEVREGDKIIYSKNVQLNAMKTFSDSVKMVVDKQKLIVNVGEKLQWVSDPVSEVLSRPREAPHDFDWSSVYGLYLEGKEFMDQKLFVQAEEKLEIALSKDHNYLPALVKMAELRYRNCQFTEAYELSKKALSIDTHDGAANYYYGLASLELGNTTDARDGFTLAALSTAFRSAAYTELSQLFLQEKNYRRSLEYASKALDFNRYHIVAYQVQATCFRLLKDSSNAERVLEVINSMNPLNPFVKAERYFHKKIAGIFVKQSFPK